MASRGRKLLLGLLVSLGLMTAVEVVLRFTTASLGRASIPAEQVQAHVQSEGLKYDPIYGWVRENLPDHYMSVDINGFRYPRPLARERQPGSFRAFTLGDSQTYGAGVMVNETYTAFAEAALRTARPDRHIELINTGLSGYGSLQALRLIQHKLLDWDPDLLVIDCRANDQPRDGLHAGAPVSAAQRLLFHYRTYYVLRFLVERSLGRNQAPMQARNARGQFLTNGNHDRIAELARANGVAVAFLDYPYWNHNNPNARADEIIACLAPAEDMPPGSLSVPACLALKQSGRPPRELFLDNNHLTAEGNRIVGETLARTLLENGLL